MTFMQWELAHLPFVFFEYLSPKSANFYNFGAHIWWTLLTISAILLV